MVSGFTLAFLVLAIIAIVGAVLAVVLLRGVDLASEPVDEHIETHVVSPFCVNRAATVHLSNTLDDAPEPTPAGRA
jgi:hypothetical protein